MPKDYYLSHHGIKGQQWGVQNGPPYPLDKETAVKIKKGTKLNSVSSSKTNAGSQDNSIYTYNADDQWDNTVYKGAYSAFMKWYDHRGDKVYEHKYEVAEDLLIPSRKEKVDTFLELYKKDRDFKDVIKDFERRNEDQYGTMEEMIDYLDAKNPDSKVNRDYRRFMMSFNQWDTDSSIRASKKFVDALKAKGYNAIVDDNNALIYNGANNPLYIFSQSLLKETGKAELVKDKEIRKNVEKIQRKYGEVIY